MDLSDKKIVSVSGPPSVTLTEEWAEMHFPLITGEVLRFNREEMEALRRFFASLDPIPVSAYPAFWPENLGD